MVRDHTCTTNKDSTSPSTQHRRASFEELHILQHLWIPPHAASRLPFSKMLRQQTSKSRCPQAPSSQHFQFRWHPDLHIPAGVVVPSGSVARRRQADVEGTSNARKVRRPSGKAGWAEGKGSGRKVDSEQASRYLEPGWGSGRAIRVRIESDGVGAESVRPWENRDGMISP